MRFRVLVAEPESRARCCLLSLLREHGAEAEAVDSVRSICGQVVACRYDLICADLGLAHEGGPDLGELLGHHRNDIELILTGESDTVRAHAHARDVGAVGFVARPYSEPRLRSLIRQAMARRRQSGAWAEPPRIVMYSHDTIGLGHMRRNANIAEEILRQRPDASVLMLLGCPAGLVFELPAGVDFVKLPSLVKLSRNEWRSDRLNITGERAGDLRKRLIRETIGAFEPDLVLVDHMPTGVWSELVDILAGLRQGPRCPEIVLGLRDILDAPGTTRRNWRKTGADRAIAELYDEVLVYGDPSLFNTARAYDLDLLAPGRVRYTGYVTARSEYLDVAAMRARLAPDGRPLALISGGGGRDAFPVISAALTGLAGIPEARRPAAMVVAGPLMPVDLRAELRSQAGAIGAACFERVANFPGCLAASDFLLGMAGYNSMVEAAAAGVPALVVPRRGPSAEQMTRAQVFAAHGLSETLPPHLATPAALGKRLAAVGRGGPRTPRLKTAGASHAAARILERMSGRAGGSPFTRKVS